MVLTMEEFCRFNLSSRIKILTDQGAFIVTRRINKELEARLYVLYGFYVEMYYDLKQNRVIKADPVRNPNWLNSFYIGLINRFNLT